MKHIDSSSSIPYDHIENCNYEGKFEEMRSLSIPLHDFIGSLITINKWTRNIVWNWLSHSLSHHNNSLNYFKSYYNYWFLLEHILYSLLDIYCTSPNIQSWVYATASVYLSVIGVFGIFTNLAVFVAFLINRKVYNLGGFEKCYRNYNIFLMHRTTIIIMRVCINIVFKCVYQLHNQFNWLLMHIVVAELLFSAFGIPIELIGSMQHGWKMGKGVCYLTGFILTSTGTN